VRRWFLPKSPDLIGLLIRQGEVAVEGMDAFSAWSRGDRSQGEAVHTAEHRADLANREVLTAITSAFVTPIGPEDIYEISERLDAVVNSAKNLIREAELLDMEPDGAMAEMADLTVLGVRHLVSAFPHLSSEPDQATNYADAAVRHQRELEHVYRKAMSALLHLDDLHEISGRRELYRRCARMGDSIEGVAHRIWYAVVKEA
jgi:uncharacterized protein